MSQIPLSQLTRVFGRIGVTSFGGPAAQIAMMHEALVTERKWLSESQFLSALSFCMLLPGPEAMQLATYSGWKLRGISGGLIAGLLFVLPGAAVILALAIGYAYWGDIPFVQSAFTGIKAAVVVIVFQALYRVAQKALKSPSAWVLAGLSFLGLFLFDLPFPLIIAIAALWGATRPIDETVVAASRPTGIGTLSTVFVWSGLWVLPVLFLWAIGADFLTEIAFFFSKLAVVTFGGAYAVLAYMAQEVIGHHHWLTPTEMVDALGLAETTPGPLILVTEFVGLLAGFKEGGLTLAILSGIVTLWVTFVPCFLWIFSAAPYLEWISSQPRPARALQAITSAVVGVILNLSIWFTLHVLFTEITATTYGPLSLLTPNLSSFQPSAIVLAVFTAALLIWRRMGILSTLALVAVAGLLLGAI